MEAKRYRVLDVATQAKSGEICEREICKMVRNFATILNTDKENICVEEVGTGFVTRCDKLLLCNAGKQLCPMK